MYELLKTDGLAKRGRLHTVHGVIETPVFMNVGTIAAIKGAVSTTDLQEIGTQVELSNTYHLHVRPGDEVVKKLGGLHKFMVWDKPILTDSGGFQVFSLAGLRRIKEEGVYFNSHIDGRKIFMGPEQSMQIQSNLASTIATHAKPELRPNFQILFYPVITMDKSYTHRGSHDNLLGNDASAELELEYSNEKQVTKDTPRAFIVYSDDDKVVPPANGVNYYLALNKKGVPSVLHIYPTGGHGWGIREDFLYKSEMQNELTSWLRSFKAPRKDAVRVACIGNSITFGAGIKNRSRDSYPSVLARMLGDSYWVKNFGVSARTMLNKGDHPYMNELAYKNALAFNPNIVVIKLGTNDSKSFNWKYKADFTKDLQTMVDAFKALPAQPKIYLCYPSKAYQTGDNINDDIISKQIIPMIKKVAKKNNLSVIDLHAAMDGMPQLFPDKIHPNEEGAKVMAKAVYQSLKK